MKIIITENQLKDKVYNLVKELGWYDTCEILGITKEEFVEMFFNNDLMEVFNLFNDLDVVQSKEQPNWTLFRDKPKHNIMVYDRKNEVVYISYKKIWSFLEIVFNLRHSKIQELTKNWLSDVYKLGEVRVFNDYALEIDKVI